MDIEKLKKLDFLFNQDHFTVEEVKQVIPVIFPTKRESINRHNTSYGIKHMIEKASCIARGRRGVWKYCTNQTLKIAMNELGYKYENGSHTAPNPDHLPNGFLNEQYNISERDVTEIFKIFNELPC